MKARRLEGIRENSIFAWESGNRVGMIIDHVMLELKSYAYDFPQKKTWLEKRRAVVISLPKHTSLPPNMP
jgi:hypothetical protein